MYSIPGFHRRRREVTALMRIVGAHPEWLYDDIRIDSVYDSFPNAIWAGGRNSSGQASVSVDTIKRATQFFGVANVALKHTFSNCQLSGEHLADYYCNLILDVSQGERTYVAINSKLLADYIREKYPNVRLVWSVTAAYSDLSIIRACQQEFEYVTILTDVFINDYDVLSTLIEGRTEVFANDLCHGSCRFRKEHYKVQSLGNLTYDNQLHEGFCDNVHGGKKKQWELILSNEQLRCLHDRYGVNHFKIYGREQEYAVWLAFICEYLFKEEHHFNVLREMTQVLRDLTDDDVYTW